MRQVWSWSHQHRSQINPPQIRCSSFSPRPLEQSYTLHNYQGCSSANIRASLASQVSSQLETVLPCRSQHQCVVPSVQCWGEGDGSKLSVVVESTMLGSLDQQRQMLGDAARFLRESFKPVFSSGGINKRDLGNPFDDNDPDNSTTTDCLDGQKEVKINSTSSYCVDCTAGYFADKTDPANEKCVQCPYDKYSENKTNAQCTACPANKGTLTPGSDSMSDCQAVCEVPNIDYTLSTEPAAGGRVLEGEEVALHCDTGFYYGNKATSNVTCKSDNATNNNFPASCRKITVSTPITSIVEGSDVILTCNLNATGPTPSYTWYKAPIGSDQYEQLSKEGVSSWYSDLYNISDFRGRHNGDYACKPDYGYPILDDMSKPVTLSVLDLRVDPSDRAHAYSGDLLNLTCSMRIDPNYPKRTIQWRKVSTNDTIVSGLTTRESEGSYHSILTLYPVERDDTDYYNCSANYTNTEGTETIALHRVFNVIVRGFVKEPEDVSILVGKEFQLECQLFVGPGTNESGATLNWKKYDEQSSSWMDVYNDNGTVITQAYDYATYISSSTLLDSG